MITRPYLWEQCLGRENPADRRHASTANLIWRIMECAPVVEKVPKSASTSRVPGNPKCRSKKGRCTAQAPSYFSGTQPGQGIPHFISMFRLLQTTAWTPLFVEKPHKKKTRWVEPWPQTYRKHRLVLPSNRASRCFTRRLQDVTQKGITTSSFNTEVLQPRKTTRRSFSPFAKEQTHENRAFDVPGCYRPPPYRRPTSAILTKSFSSLCFA